MKKQKTIKVTLEIPIPDYIASAAKSGCFIPKNEYWSCFIGPVKRAQLPVGADFPMRQAVIDAFSKLTNNANCIVYSGWGRDIGEYHAQFDIARQVEKAAQKELNDNNRHG